MEAILDNFPSDLEPVITDVIALVTAYGLSVLGALVTLIVGLWLSGWASRVVSRAMRRAPRMDPTLVSFAASLVKYLVVVFTVIAVLGKFGVQTASLLTVLGAAGLAIGLALQGTLGHIAAGIMLLIFRPFRVGDEIETDKAKGTVKEITLFVTNIVTPEGVFTIVPNGLIWGTAIRNLSVKS